VRVGGFPNGQSHLSHQTDGLLERTRLAGASGEAIHAVLVGAGHNIRLLLAWLSPCSRPSSFPSTRPVRLKKTQARHSRKRKGAFSRITICSSSYLSLITSFLGSLSASRMWRASRVARAPTCRSQPTCRVSPCILRSAALDRCLQPRTALTGHASGAAQRGREAAKLLLSFVSGENALQKVLAMAG
jgi:hypothetical protein